MKKLTNIDILDIFSQKLNNFCTKTQEFSPKLNTILLKTQFSGNSTNLRCRKNAEKKACPNVQSIFRGFDFPVWCGVINISISMTPPLMAGVEWTIMQWLHS